MWWATHFICIFAESSCDDVSGSRRTRIQKAVRYLKLTAGIICILLWMSGIFVTASLATRRSIPWYYTLIVSLSAALFMVVGLFTIKRYLETSRHKESPKGDLEKYVRV